MVDRMTRHVRYAARLLARSPLFTLTAVASLAIGIGANVAIFAVANALLLAPTKGVREMNHVIDIGRTTEGRGFDTVSYLTFADLRDRNTVFDGVYAVRLEPQPFSMGAEDGAVRVYGEQVSAGYFDVLGLTPAAGTFFHGPEEKVGEPLRKIVISHTFWTRQFDGRQSAVGQELILNGDRFTIVGVTPESYHGTTILSPDFWVPLTAHARAMPDSELLTSRRSVFLSMGARLKPGVSIVQAQAYLNAFMRGLADEYPDLYRTTGLRAAPASRVPGEFGQFVTPFVAVLMGVVGLVLLVACTNLAGLLLSRATDRTREVAVRLALGAPRRSIVGMLMSETLLVFAIGAAAGCLVAAIMTRLLASAVTALPVPVAVDMAADWRVLLFALALTLLTGVLTGLAPALRSARLDVISDLRKDARTTPRRQRLRRAFITAQLAFCLVLVVVAGLFLRALGTATQIDPGFEVERIDVATVDLALGAYPPDRAAGVADEIRTRLAGLPGVESVAMGVTVPLDGNGLGLGGLRRPGTSGPEAHIESDWNVVSPEFLPTLGTAIVQGRNFAASDRTGAPDVAIVNEHFAAAVWPGQNPIGQVLENGDFFPGGDPSIRRLTVVGVARDVKYRWLGEPPRSFIYVPFEQYPMRSVNYFIRRSDRLADAAGLQAGVRRTLRSFDPNLPLIRIAPLRTYADVGLLPQRLAATIAGSLGIVALLLAAIGVYGVTAFAVAGRTREIGVRMALGADPARVVREMVMQGLRLTAIGAAIGLACALVVTQLLAGLLFGVSPLDPTTYLATTAVLAGIGLAATYLPARRAARVDPLMALRIE